MNTWYYTLIFIFSCITVGKLLITFVMSLISPTPARLEMTEKEKILYGATISYLLTYLIYI